MKKINLLLLPKSMFSIPFFATLILIGTQLPLTPANSVEHHMNHSQTPTQVAHPAAPNLNPAQGSEIGSSYEAFLSPHQEPDEEANTPEMTPKEFKSTAPSLARKDRKSRGHGILRFSKDLSRAFVDVKLENVDPDQVVMFHIHCGKPDMLGPIIVDFGVQGSFKQHFKNGLFSLQVSNEDINQTAHSGHSIVSAFTSGCPIVPEQPLLGKVKTVAGMEHIARRSELYFNLHTKGQTFYGDIRGQLHPLKP
ncbi:MAG: CHRD domain-containing protein [Candidatus Sericytochromatia bacterium]